LDIKLLGAFAKLWKATITFVISVRLSMFLSVRPAWNTSVTTWRILKKFGIWDFFWKYIEKIQVSLTLILLTWRIWWAPNNVNKWQVGFNLAFKGLKSGKNKGHFTWKPIHTFHHISLSSS